MTSDQSTRDVRFQWQFLLPKFWLTWLLLLFLWLLMFAPRTWVMGLGGWVGDQFRKRNRKRRRIVEVNLELCFPDWTNEEREALCEKHFRAYGRGLVDMGLSFWGSEKRLKSWFQ